jgi:hypothetical protein
VLALLSQSKAFCRKRFANSRRVRIATRPLQLEKQINDELVGEEATPLGSCGYCERWYDWCLDHYDRTGDVDATCGGTGTELVFSAVKRIASRDSKYLGMWSPAALHEARVHPSIRLFRIRSLPDCWFSERRAGGR